MRIESVIDMLQLETDFHLKPTSSFFLFMNTFLQINATKIHKRLSHRYSWVSGEDTAQKSGFNFSATETGWSRDRCALTACCVPQIKTPVSLFFQDVQPPFSTQLHPWFQNIVQTL